MNEYYEFRSKRIKELDEAFEITHFYGDDYPENINVEINKIINNEWKLNNLQSKIDKANQYLEERFIFDDENGEYYQTHTFDKNNAKELHNILKEDK